MITKFIFAAFAVAVALGAPASAETSAQIWPQRSVKFLVPLGPGAGVDIGARLLADRLSARWGQPVVVENRPGGDAIVAISTFVGAHDDHVLLCAPTSSFTAHPFLHDDLPYKPSDLVPIARVSNTIVSLAVPASLKVGSIADLVAAARTRSGALNWVGTTGALDFLFAGFLKSTGVAMTKVPYRNPVEAANDLGEDRVQAYLSALTIVRPQLQAGKVRLIAVTNSVRAPTEPNVPTAAEAGYPVLAIDGLVGLFGPQGMASELRERIAADVRTVAADPVVGARLTDTGQILNVGGPAEFGAAIEEQRAKIAAIARDLGIKAGR